MISKDSVVTDYNGEKYLVVKLLSDNTAEGDVYKVERLSDGELFALKLYKDRGAQERANLLERIKIMALRGSICKGVCVKPLAILEHEGRVGFLMEYVGDDYVPSSVMYLGERGEDGRKYEFPFNEKIQFLYNLCDAVARINNAKLCLIDLKFDNVHVNLKTMEIKILDTDSVIYENEAPSVVGTVGFMPPLTMSGKEVPNINNDRYALAVMIFMTLLGSHPLEGAAMDSSAVKDLNDYIYCTHPVYVFHPTDNSNRPVAGNKFGAKQQRTIDRAKRYPAYFMQAFRMTFVEGLFDGSKRIDAETWRDLLGKLYQDSFCCECGEEYFLGDGEKVCKVCPGGKFLKRPLFICGDKNKPLFYGDTILSNELWFTDDEHEVFRVEKTKYDGKVGLKVLTSQAVKLFLKDGTEKHFEKDEAFPIVMDGMVECGIHTITFSKT